MTAEAIVSRRQYVRAEIDGRSYDTLTATRVVVDGDVETYVTAGGRVFLVYDDPEGDPQRAKVRVMQYDEARCHLEQYQAQDACTAALRTHFDVVSG